MTASVSGENTDMCEISVIVGRDIPSPEETNILAQITLGTPPGFPGTSIQVCQALKKKKSAPRADHGVLIFA